MIQHFLNRCQMMWGFYEIFEEKYLQYFFSKCFRAITT